MTVRAYDTGASRTDGSAVLEISNFSVDYGIDENAVHAINNVSLHIDRGRVLGLAGESGSGKSTLVYAATRLLRSPGVITGGEVTLRLSKDEESGTERSVNMLTATQRELRSVRWKHVSIVLQSALSSLNPVRRIGREFDEVLRTHRRGMNKSQRRARAVELLAMVGLDEDRLARFPHELSGGQRQRIMIAIALALDPELVIMDEPTTALDVVTQREIINELYELRARFGFAMIFITHDLSLLVELADEIAVMYAGTIVERASASDLYNAPRHPYTLGLLNSFPPLHGEHRDLSGIPGSPPDLSNPPQGCAYHPRCPYVLERCSTQVPPLLEVEGEQRAVACWLHDSTEAAQTAVELRRPSVTSVAHAVTSADEDLR